MNSDVKAIIFDFGGVMEQFYRPAQFRAQEAQLGLQSGTLSEILWRSPDWRLAEVGGITDEEYWRRTGPRLGLRTEGEIRDFQEAMFGDVESDPRMVDMVQRLRRRYRTALLSNATDILPQLLRERFGLDGLFDVEVISALVGLAKPDPAIFRLALDRLGMAPQATVFIDDSQPNVEAAAALGIQAIRFVGYEALIRALEERRVLIGP